MNLVVLTLHDLMDFPLPDWIDLGRHELSVFADLTSQTVTDVEEHRRRGYRRVDFFDNYINNGLIEQEVLRLHRAAPVAQVVSFGEDDVVRAALLRRALGLPGQDLDSAVAYRDKVTMKRVAAQAGIPVPRFRALSHPLDLIEFETEVGLPLFVKPRSSSGSTSGRTLRTPADRDQLLSRGFQARLPFSEYASDLMVEEFIDGELFHVDGVVIDGQLALAVPSRYGASSLELRRMKDDQALTSATLDPDDPRWQPLVDFTARVLGALPSPRTFPFHCELFATTRGLLLCEVACRTGGAKVNVTIEAATGVDLNELAFLGQVFPESCSGRFQQRRTRARAAGWTLLCPREVTVTGVPAALPDWVAHFQMYASIGDRTDGRHYSGDKIAAAVVTGANHDAVCARIAELNQWFLTTFTTHTD